MLWVKEISDFSMIGHFGVGFYSTVLVSDKVTLSKNNLDDHIYLGEAGGHFNVLKDTVKTSLWSGIILPFKEEQEEFVNERSIKVLV